MHGFRVVVGDGLGGGVACEEEEETRSIPNSLISGFKTTLTLLDLHKGGGGGGGGGLITQLEPLMPCRALRWLNLSGNGIRHLPAPSSWPNLQVLLLRDNAIASWRELIHLTGFSSLCVLSLEGNPVTKLLNYRAFTVNSAPSSLKLLDGFIVADEELVEGADHSPLYSPRTPRMRCTLFDNDDALSSLMGLPVYDITTAEDVAAATATMSRLGVVGHPTTFHADRTATAAGASSSLADTAAAAGASAVQGVLGRLLQIVFRLHASCSPVVRCQRWWRWLLSSLETIDGYRPGKPISGYSRAHVPRTPDETRRTRARQSAVVAIQRYARRVLQRWRGERRIGELVASAGDRGRLAFEYDLHPETTELRRRREVAMWSNRNKGDRFRTTVVGAGTRGGVEDRRDTAVVTLQRWSRGRRDALEGRVARLRKRMEARARMSPACGGGGGGIALLFAPSPHGPAVIRAVASALRAEACGALCDGEGADGSKDKRRRNYLSQQRQCESTARSLLEPSDFVMLREVSSCCSDERVPSSSAAGAEARGEAGRGDDYRRLDDAAIEETYWQVRGRTGRRRRAERARELCQEEEAKCDGSGNLPRGTRFLRLASLRMDGVLVRRLRRRRSQSGRAERGGGFIVFGTERHELLAASAARGGRDGVGEDDLLQRRAGFCAGVALRRRGCSITAVDRLLASQAAQRAWTAAPATRLTAATPHFAGRPQAVMQFECSDPRRMARVLRHLRHHEPNFPVVFAEQAAAAAGAASIQAMWRSPRCRRRLRPTLGEACLARRACVCLQRWWRWHKPTGCLLARMRFLDTISTASQHYQSGCIDATLFIEADLFYALTVWLEGGNNSVAAEGVVRRRQDEGERRRAREGKQRKKLPRLPPSFEHGCSFGIDVSGRICQVSESAGSSTPLPPPSSSRQLSVGVSRGRGQRRIGIPDWLDIEKPTEDYFVASCSDLLVVGTDVSLVQGGGIAGGGRDGNARAMLGLFGRRGVTLFAITFSSPQEARQRALALMTATWDTAHSTGACLFTLPMLQEAYNSQITTVVDSERHRQPQFACLPSRWAAKHLPRPWPPRDRVQLMTLCQAYSPTALERCPPIVTQTATASHQAPQNGSTARHGGGGGGGALTARDSAPPPQKPLRLKKRPSSAGTRRTPRLPAASAAAALPTPETTAGRGKFFATVGASPSWHPEARGGSPTGKADRWVAESLGDGDDIFDERRRGDFEDDNNSDGDGCADPEKAYAAEVVRQDKLVTLRQMQDRESRVHRERRANFESRVDDNNRAAALKQIRRLHLPIDMATLRRAHKVDDRKQQQLDEKRRRIGDTKAKRASLRAANDARRIVVEAERLRKIVDDKIETEAAIANREKLEEAKRRKTRRRKRAARLEQKMRKEDANVGASFAQQTCMLARHVSAGVRGWAQEQHEADRLAKVASRKDKRRADREQVVNALEQGFNARRVAALRQREVARNNVSLCEQELQHDRERRAKTRQEQRNAAESAKKIREQQRVNKSKKEHRQRLRDKDQEARHRADCEEAKRVAVLKAKQIREREWAAPRDDGEPGSPCPRVNMSEKLVEDLYAQYSEYR